jgi:4-hydroxybenzoate polyprenyltransferase
MTQSNPTTASAAPRNSFGITALVLALVGLVSGLSTGFLALPLGALAVLFGLLGWARIRRNEATNRKVTVLGMVLGVGAMAIGIWGITLVLNG